MHTTNYYNTLIEIAEDCPEHRGEVPPVKGDKRTVANLQFDMIYDHPYEYTSDELIFTIHALRKEIPKGEWKEEYDLFYSKGQPCLRSSPLAKRYGWGVHSDSNGRIAIYGCETEEYRQLVNDPGVQKVKAMRSKRK